MTKSMDTLKTKYPEDDLLMLSALQHLLFCPRQCALIYIEQLWCENRLTAEGRILHERVHTASSESRVKILVEFDLPIRSLILGISGRADVVGFHLVDATRALHVLFDDALPRRRCTANAVSAVHLFFMPCSPEP